MKRLVLVLPCALLAVVWMLGWVMAVVGERKEMRK